MQADQFIIGVFTVVFDDQKRILLGHRRDMDLWDLPGGGMDHGELPNETAIREAKEETGMDIKIERLLGVFAFPPPKEKQIVFGFLGHVIGGKPTINNETDDVRFFAVDELPENISPRKQALIQMALNHPYEPVFRHTDLPHAKDWLAQQKGK